MNAPRMKRYTIRYLPPEVDEPGTWAIYDHGTHGMGNDTVGIIEAGYSKQGAIRAAAFHNYKALGAGPWRPYRKERAR